jgi:hypothetical protein
VITPTTRRRAIVLALPVTYVAVAAASRGDAEPRTWASLGLAMVVVVLGARAASAAEPLAREVLACAAGLSVVLATATLAGRPGWAAAARAIGALVAAFFAARALATIEGDAGLAARAIEAEEPRGIGPEGIARGGVIAVLLTWGTAAGVDLHAWLTGSPGSTNAAPVVAATAGALSLFALGAASLLVAGARRLELAAPPRALACAGRRRRRAPRSHRARHRRRPCGRCSRCRDDRHRCRRDPRCIAHA